MLKKLAMFALVFAVVAAATFAGGQRDTEAVEPATDPEYGGTLTHKIHWGGGGVNTFDTSDLARGVLAHTWTSPYAETLLIGDIETYGPRGTGEYDFTAYELVPEQYLKGHIAERWEWEDPLTIVFHIREGVMWTGRDGIMDSREMTAEDIAFSMNRQWERYKEQGSRQFDYISSVSARDRYTLEVQLHNFYADWAFHLGYRGITQALIPPEVAEAGPQDWRNAVGTGPFKITNYVDDSQAVFERNPDYWDVATIDGQEYELPFVDRLVIPIMPDMSSTIAALRTGQIDWQVNVPMEYRDTLRNSSPELVLEDYLAGQTGFIALNLTKEPFSDRNVRRALMMGTDLESIAEDVYIEADVHGGPLNALTPYYTPMDELPDSVRELYSNDPDRAAQMLADAGYPDGFSMSMYVANNNQTAMAAIEMLEDQWRNRFNIDLQMRPVDSAQLGNLESGRHTEERPGGMEDSLIMTMATTTPWIAFDRLGLYDSFKNPSQYDDQHFAETFAAAEGMRDMDERNETIRELALYWLDDVPYIPLPNPYVQTAYWPWVRNYYGEVESAYYNHSAITSRIWIDQNLKAGMGF